ncbi:DUF6282 family protein [Gryllotalpicola ginsengisoli]|uniref:DUF6282 family protein n=1 Tax=Gryllotalpicola ginsengisoli TaxID=444608 RepID=UPI0003B47714|nr:DUF6282 family protein [Gryllotalpicola ginsengisoli]
MAEEHPQPSDYARKLVEGAYDLHVHVAPDVMKRRINDIELARRFRERRLAGFVLKSHYVPTAERAEVVRYAVPEVDALGAITLNAAVGGLNPSAVDIAGREGARVVWFPTVDGRNQRDSRAELPPGAVPPMWAALQDELKADGLEPAPIDVLDGHGEVNEEARAVLKLIAKYKMTLATGHLSGTEIVALVHAAHELGVSRIIVTHPEFTSQRLDVQTQKELAALGAFLERCFTTPHSGKVSWDELQDHIRDVGPEHSILSSDLGQPFNPPVEDGLPIMADHLHRAGFSDDEIRTMAVANTRHLAVID